MPTFEQNAFGERYLPEINGPEFQAQSAHHALDRHFSLDFTQADCLYVIIGSDSGLLLEYLAQLTTGSGTRFIVVELDDCHAAIAEHYPRFARHERITLASESEWRGHLSDSDLVRYLYAGKLMLTESLGCRKDHSGRYQPMMRRLKKVLEDRQRNIAARINNKLFIDCQLHNAADNLVPASVLNGIGLGATAIVLGGGPSLDEHIPWIRANRHRLVVFAVSRLCAKLDGLDLRPDVVVSVDPQEGTFDVSKEGVRWHDTLLANHYHVAPTLLKQWRGPSVYLGSVLPWRNAIDTPETRAGAVGPTVSHTAVWLAYELGFEQILLCGVDLCYSAAGGTHATGTIEEKVGALALDIDAEVATYSGSRASTNYNLKSSIEAMAQYAGKIRESGRSIYNLGARAAVVNHIAYRAPQDVRLPASRPDITLMASAEAIDRHFDLLGTELKHAHAVFSDIRKRCRQAIRYVDRFHGIGGKPPDARYRKMLDRLEQRLTADYDDFVELIKQFANVELSALARPSGFDALDELAFAEWGKSYYRILARAAGQLRERVDAVQQRLAMRKLERSSNPDIARLLDYWTDDASPGRAWLMLHRRGYTPTPDEQRLLDAAVACFDERLDSDDTGYSRRLQSKGSSIHQLVESIVRLFQGERAAELARFSEVLTREQEPKRIVGYLASGLGSELSGNIDTAYEHYQQAIDAISDRLESQFDMDDELSVLLENVLLRICHVNLARRDVAASIESFGVLTQHNLVHAPAYARLLAFNGLRTAAIDVLDIYLDACPSDWRSQETLAELHRECGNANAADAAMTRANEARPRRHEQRAA